MKHSLLAGVIVLVGITSLPVLADAGASWSANVHANSIQPPPPIYYPPPIVYVVPQPVYPPLPVAEAYIDPRHPALHGYAGRPEPPSRFDSSYRSPPNFLWRRGQFQPGR